MTYYSILNFFPVTFTNVYDPIPVRIGLRGLAPGFTTAIGAIVFNAALSKFPNHTREVLLLAVAIMTSFAGALSVMTPENESVVLFLGSIAGFGVGGHAEPRGRPWSSSWFSMATDCQYSRYRCSLPLCWISSGSLWKTTYRPFWLYVYMRWLRPSWFRSHLCTNACRHGHLWCWRSVSLLEAIENKRADDRTQRW